MKISFTTFEVGEICQVYHTTVINWINKGQLKAYKTPGKHRRIQRDDLIMFMEEFNIPIPGSLKDLNKKVLVVDDDPNIHKVLKKALARIPSLQIQTSDNGIEALVSIGRDMPDLVFLDIIMPGMDGIQVCQTLATNVGTSKTKIIVLTGQRLTNDQEKFLHQNVDAIFPKPFSTLDLIEKTSTLLGLEVAHPS